MQSPSLCHLSSILGYLGNPVVKFQTRVARIRALDTFLQKTTSEGPELGCSSVGSSVCLKGSPKFSLINQICMLVFSTLKGLEKEDQKFILS